MMKDDGQRVSYIRHLLKNNFYAKYNITLKEKY